jgi:hypothetical protein
MAGDLIPPPSPAGRPERAGSDSGHELRSGAAPEPPAATADPVEPRRARGPAPFRARFGFVFGALAGIAVCTAALAVVLATTSDDSGVRLEENWSEWKPQSGDTLVAAQDIAEHVGAQYRRNDGDQLVNVQAGPIAVDGLAAGVAVRPQGGAIELLEGAGLMYAFDGLGASGALEGKPTEARGSLLRREALELALYTFRYLEDVTMVAVMLPPPRPEQREEGDEEQAQLVKRQAVFYRPGDLLTHLQVPLDHTLRPQVPRPNTLSADEASLIDSLTLKHIFVSEWRSASGNLPYLVLREPARIE